MTGHVEATSGVQELIDKLKNQGVVEGKVQADQIIKQAQVQASQIIESAKTESDRLFAEAKNKIEIEKASAQASIRLAFRDTELNLRSKFREAFSNYVRRLVSYELKDKEFIKQLVLVIASLKAPLVEQASKIEIELPAKLLESEGKEMQFTEEGKKRLGHLLLGITTEMLREGVVLKPSEELVGGIRVHLLGEDMEIDLSDEALSNMLLKYLLPRYRAIVSGQQE
jgi:V/A-type H+-transporting ATPase subunit E